MTYGQPLPFIAYWYLAYREPIGIKITCTNLQSLKTRLYAARKESLDSDLMEIRLVTSPINPDTELWLIHAQSIPASVPLPPARRKPLQDDLDDI